MLQIIKRILLKIVDNIDSGNSNMTSSDQLKILEVLKEYTDKEVRLSKYQVCKYIGLSRASFDNYVRFGSLPKGIKQQGFKELFWTKKSLDKFLKEREKKEKKKEKNNV